MVASFSPAKIGVRGHNQIIKWKAHLMVASFSLAKIGVRAHSQIIKWKAPSMVDEDIKFSSAGWGADLLGTGRSLLWTPCAPVNATPLQNESLPISLSTSRPLFLCPPLRLSARPLPLLLQLLLDHPCYARHYVHQRRRTCLFCL